MIRGNSLEMVLCIGFELCPGESLPPILDNLDSTLEAFDAGCYPITL